MSQTYLHTEIPELSTGFLDEGNVHVGAAGTVDNSTAMDQALASVRLAVRLGIQPAYAAVEDPLPYADNDNLVFGAPLTSALVNKPMHFLRGWKHFESCVKGFNSLGLMGHHICNEQERLKSLPVSELNEIKLAFLKSRAVDGKKVFKAADLKGISETEFLEIDAYDLAIWNSFGQRPIFCSTSSNMGISSHQALRLMQEVNLSFREKAFTLLNKDEGELIIWAPDERADFMNMEKITFLRGLTEEQPQITRLRTYINRQQRDPGALRDAFLTGGYFFPTNPQSADEMQNLIFIALRQIASEQEKPISEVLEMDCVLLTLASLRCSVDGEHVIVPYGVEGGIYGLMTPYIIMLEEFLMGNMGKSVSTWNQASIGAAFAAAALADTILRDPGSLQDSTRSELNSLFPALSRFLDAGQLGRDIQSRVHGVFDLANLQSLAQLLGVVVEKHLSGRGTAYVGLGSSSYSNGNRCFEILKDSINRGGSFKGKDAFHPATHSVNPFAAAIVYGEDMWRALRRHDLDSISDEDVISCFAHVRKPEPAGAAAMAGYLLSRLDTETLSMIEIAYMLKLVGFNKNRFLAFANYDGDQGLRTFLQEAAEEGPCMGDFAKNMLLLLDWTESELERRTIIEKRQSRARYLQAPLDDLGFEAAEGPTGIYLTGDNCAQPDDAFNLALGRACIANKDRIQAFLGDFAKSAPDSGPGPIDGLCLFFCDVTEKVASATANLAVASRRMTSDRLSRRHK